jgi:hypothetical protein
MRNNLTLAVFLFLFSIVILAGVAVSVSGDDEVKTETKVITIMGIGENDGHFVGIFRLHGELMSVPMDEYEFADSIIGSKFVVEVKGDKVKLKGIVE